MLPSLAIFHGWMLLSRPGTLNVASKGLFQYFAICARDG
jgi:hypothetical protein